MDALPLRYAGMLKPINKIPAKRMNATVNLKVILIFLIKFFYMVVPFHAYFSLNVESE